MAKEPVLEKRLDMVLLADFYGPLLTDKQRLALRLFYEEDFSLGEIAAECATSRQAAHDLIRRSEALLADYEQKLHLLARHQAQEALLTAAEDLLFALGIDEENTAAAPFWQLWQKIKEGE